MKKFLFIVLGLLIIGAGVFFYTQNTNSKNVLSTKKTLVAYFSATGVTKQVAENLSKATDSDVYEIKPVTKYTSDDLNWRDNNSRSYVEMHAEKSRPEIVDDGFSIDNYETIFLGFPIWWGTAPVIVHTFLEKYDLSNKKIIIFATSGSSGLGETSNNLKKSVPDSTEIVDGKILNGNPSVEELKAWVETLEK